MTRLITQRVGSVYIICKLQGINGIFFVGQAVNTAQYTLNNTGFVTCSFLITYETTVYLISIFRDSATQLRYKTRKI